MSTRTRPVSIGPGYEAVRQAVRAALYSPDPLKRAEAAGNLTLWGLPVAPDAVVIAAERIARKAAVA